MKKYTEQELEQIREEYMEEVTKAFNELHEAFNAYLDACSAFEFNNGFLYAQMLRESKGE